MQLNLSVNLEKRHLIFVVVLVCVLFVAGVAAYNSGQQPSVFGHSDGEIANVSAGKVVAGTFGAAAGFGDFAFPDNLIVSNTLSSVKITASNITSTNTITLGGVARSTWPLGVYPQDCGTGYVVKGVNSNGYVYCAWPLVPTNWCPTGQFMNGISQTGERYCATPATPATPTITCTVSLTGCYYLGGDCEVWRSCPGNQVIRSVKVLNDRTASDCIGPKGDKTNVECCIPTVTCTAS